MKLHSDALNSVGQRLSALRNMFLFSPSHSKKVAKHYLKLGHEDVTGKKGMTPRIFNLSITWRWFVSCLDCFAMGKQPPPPPPYKKRLGWFHIQVWRSNGNNLWPSLESQLTVPYSQPECFRECLHIIDTTWKTTEPAVQSELGIKRPKREPEPILSFSIQIKNSLSYESNCVCLHVAVLRNMTWLLVN